MSVPGDEHQGIEDVNLQRDLDRFDSIGEHTHEEEVDTSTPTHLTEGFRGLNPGAVVGVLVAGVAAIGLVIGLIIHAQGASTGTTTAAPSAAPLTLPNLVSSVVPGYNANGQYGRPGYHDTDGEGVTPAPSASGFQFGEQNGSPRQPIGAAQPTGSCPTGYHDVSVPSTQVPGTQTTMCGINAPAGTATNGVGGVAAPAPTLTPEPSQIVAFDAPQSAGGNNAGTASGAQEQQAQRDLASRGVAIAPAPAQPMPVYANGRFVGYVYPPAQPIEAGLASSAAQQPAQDTEFASSEPTTQTQAPTSAAAATAAPQTASGVASSPFGYAPTVSEDQLDAMSVIRMSLVSSVNSDLPGTFLAQTTDNVYDSRSHRHIVIPAGTIVSGSYDSRLVAGQTRLLAMVTELRFADGREFYLGSQEATDALGSSGMTGSVDTHSSAILRSALLLTVLGAASAALAPQTTSLLEAPSLASQIQSAAGAQVANVGNKLIDTAINRAPTITIDPSAKPYLFSVLVMRDLPLNRYEVQPQISRLVPVATTPAPPRVMPQPVTVPVPTQTPAPTRFCC